MLVERVCILSGDRIARDSGPAQKVQTAVPRPPALALNLFFDDGMLHSLRAFAMQGGCGEVECRR